MSEPGRPRFAAVVGAAAFLACSWTWCIGMFLPVLLYRDFGPWSFLAFAIPNCIGAAVMGRLLAKPGASESFLARHGFAARVFSAVTIAFQVFFVFWLLADSEPMHRYAAAALLAVGTALGLQFRRGGSWLTTPALLVLAASAALAAWWLLGDQPPRIEFHAGAGLLPSPHLVPLALVCAFGFALCPYLDLTFHAVRQQFPGPAGSAAFAIGFLALFPFMILITFLAAPGLVIAGSKQLSGVSPALLALPIQLHVGLQLGFTIGAHDAALRRPSAGGFPASAFTFAGAAVGLLAAAAAERVQIEPLAFSPFEAIYRVFMGFYGFFAPAWLVLSHLSRRSDRSTIPVAAALFVLLAVASTFAFLLSQTWYALAGLGAVALAALVVRRQGSAASGSPSL